MADVEQLLADYAAEHRSSGEADPRRYLDQAAPGQRAELAALIDAYLAQARGRDWDPGTFAQSRARDVADAVSLSLGGVNGAWPWLLPSLRRQAEMPRSEVVRKLAEALEVSEREDKVLAYYHRMETGDLPASGVSERVLEALGKILGTSGEVLRRAGEILEPGIGGEATGAVFARAARADPAFEAADADVISASLSTGPLSDIDEVDELFTEVERA